MEASSITTEPAAEDLALKSLHDAFGSRFSIDNIASAFCKAGQDPNVAAQILCGTQTGPSSYEMHASNGILTSKTSSQASTSNNFPKSSHANGYRPNVPGVKTNPAAVGTVSSMLGKKYVWRPVGSNGSSNATKPSKVHRNGYCVSQTPINQSVLARDATLSPSEERSVSRDTNLDDDIVDFLFEMLGRGFQLERSAIQEVLGNCGYDMKKGLETLLDLSAASLDRRNNIPKCSNLHPSSKTLSSQNPLSTQKIAESNRCGKNGMQPNGRYEQQRDVLTSLFHAPVRPDPEARVSITESAEKYRATRLVVCEPLEDLDDFSVDFKVNFARPHHANTKDEADEDAYQILRKAVKEHRGTMREYYKAAAEAFASGDRARATLLLEKGQYYYNKAREADEESASKIFETSDGGGEVQDDISLDLQVHDGKEAIQLVKCHLRSLSGIPSIKNLKILIGKGDQRDVQKRRRLVKMLLERADIKWDEDEDSGTITIRVDEINPKSLSFSRK